MQNYDPRLSLAPRDIVARAIDSEMKKRGTDCMYLDCRHIEESDFVDHFPTIHEKCMKIGVNPKSYDSSGASLPLYLWRNHGGRAWTSSIHRLYAAGECSSTGLHGANRLASNSLLEALVFAHRIAEDVSLKINEWSIQSGVPDWNVEGTTDPKEMVLITQGIKELKDIMSYYVGIVRSNIRSKRALDRLFLLYEETEELYRSSTISPQLMELRNLITIAYLITRSAAHRRESRGLHFTTDYPEQLSFLEYSAL